MAASSEDFLAQALLSLKDANNDQSVSTSKRNNNYFMGSTLKDVDQRILKESPSMYHTNRPPVLLEPSIIYSNNDIDSFQKLQLKSLMNTKEKSSSFYNGNKKVPSNTNIHSLLSTTTTTSTTNNQYLPSQVNSSFLPPTTPLDSHGFTMTFSSNNNNQKGFSKTNLSSNNNNGSSSTTTATWDLACTYSGVGISKPRKMMINRWYAESLTSPTKSLDAIVDQFELSSSSTSEMKEKKEEVDSTLLSSDSGDDAEEEYTQPSGDSLDEDDELSSCSSSEELGKKLKSSPKQVKKKTASTTPVIRKKKKHTTKGQFNTGWWSDDEHQRFLKGLKECGHNWKLISTKYVKTRGRRQCASHAQKWYLSIRYSEEREQMEKL